MPISTYLSNIPRNLNSMVLCSTTIHEIDNLIRQLPNKTSHGFDNISNTMLKSLRTSIIFPLCHIFNCSLMEGSFPERMKKAEVIPLYKGKDMNNMINYQPISLLITLSKLLEKLCTPDYMDIWNIIIFCILANMDFELKDLVNKPSLNLLAIFCSQKIVTNIVLVFFSICLKLLIHWTTQFYCVN